MSKYKNNPNYFFDHSSKRWKRKSAEKTIPSMTPSAAQIVGSDIGQDCCEGDGVMHVKSFHHPQGDMCPVEILGDSSINSLTITDGKPGKSIKDSYIGELEMLGDSQVFLVNSSGKIVNDNSSIMDVHVHTNGADSSAEGVVDILCKDSVMGDISFNSTSPFKVTMKGSTMEDVYVIANKSTLSMDDSTIDGSQVTMENSDVTMESVNVYGNIVMNDSDVSLKNIIFTENVTFPTGSHLTMDNDEFLYSGTFIKEEGNPHLHGRVEGLTTQGKVMSFPVHNKKKQ